MSDSKQPRYLDGSKLKDARLDAGLEQHELGDMVGATQGQVSGWERKKTGCHLEMLRRLAAALGKQPRDLMLDSVLDPDDGQAAQAEPAPRPAGAAA